MRIPTYTNKSDFWILLAVMIPFATAVNYMLFDTRLFSELSIFIPATIASVIIFSLDYQLLTMIALAFRSRFPEYRQTVFRISLSMCVYILVNSAAICLVFLGYDYFHFLGYHLDVEKLEWTLLMGLLANIFATTLNEGIYTFEQWRAMLVESEKLKKANLQSQLESLKNQVNPHFLFNSLNSLSSLIADDPQKAEAFLDELSKVYRYLLRNNEAELTDLSTELQFIRSYFHLLKTRYGEGIMWELSIDEKYLEYLLPPLTLQLLVENAVKHNVISPDQPLLIRITTERGGMLTIRNNLQRKSLRVQSNQVGLANIATKYQLLNQPEVVVHNDEQHFQVIIPLIKNQNP